MAELGSKHTAPDKDELTGIIQRGSNIFHHRIICCVYEASDIKQLQSH